MIMKPSSGIVAMHDDHESSDIVAMHNAHEALLLYPCVWVPTSRGNLVAANRSRV